MEKVFESHPEFLLEAEARGRPLRLKIDPAAPWFVLLNGGVAKELRLVGTRSATFAVGPVRLKGKTRSEKLAFAGVTANRPVMWFDRDMVRGADGVINPANLPWDRVTMRLGEPRPDEQLLELPMRFDRERGLYHEFSFGGQLILTRFTLADPLTTATGAAASLIAKRRNGIWDGGTFTRPVRYGIVRPVRNMVLSEPLSLKGFRLSELAVRIWDDRGSYWLPQKELATEEIEGDVVVIGKRGGIFGTPHFWLMIGSEDLKRCSSISYDKKRRRLSLSCSLANSS